MRQLGDGAHALRADARPARRGEGQVRRVVDAAARPHRRQVPGRREAGDDRVVRSRVPRRLRRERGRHRVHDLVRGVVGASRFGRPLRAAVHRADPRRPARRAAAEHRGAALLP